MKAIVNKTILKQGDKIYQPVEVDGVIYWVDENIKGEKGWNYNFGLGKIDKLLTYYANFSSEWNFCRKIIAQSQPKLEGIPVISLDSYVEYINNLRGIDKANSSLKDEFILGYNSNPNQYTQKDIEKAIKLAQQGYVNTDEPDRPFFEFRNENKRIIDQINSISIIEVDEQFNIISYE